MKNLGYIRDLTLTWLISIVALAMCFAIADLPNGGGMDKLFASIFLFFIISIPFSLPAFIFFTVCGMMILKKEMPLKKKKIRLILLNYVDIILTSFVMLAVINPGKYQEDDLYILALPLILIIASTISIFLLPFKKTNKNTRI